MATLIGLHFGVGWFWPGFNLSKKLQGAHLFVGIAFFLGLAGGGPHSIVSAKNVCINNLRQIDAAKEQWAMDYGKASGAAIVESVVATFLKDEEGGGHFGVAVRRLN